MAENPYLPFPDPTPSTRPAGRGRSPQPIGDRQRTRLAPQLQRLRDALRRATLTSAIDGAAPDLILVIEARDRISDMASAAQRVGLVVLGEDEFEGLEFDEIEREVLQKDGTPATKGVLYLTLADSAAQRSLLANFARFEQGQPYPPGHSDLWRMFDLIHNIRLWDASDRIEGTGFRERLVELRAMNVDTARVEIELWYKPQVDPDVAKQKWLANIGDTARVIDELVLPEIAFQGMLVEVAISDALLGTLTDAPNAGPGWLTDDRVKSVRPAAQFASRYPTVDDGEPVADHGGDRNMTACNPDEQPLVAVLDGIPQAGHPVLDGRVQVDDPESWEDGVAVENRRHGTAMCSIVCHGDLRRAGRSLARPIYLRPILRPVENWPDMEEMPEDRLAVDLLHEAVIRLVRDRPSIRIVNLSIGEGDAAHLQQASPLARLVDYLAWRYGLLFVVSAGNRLEDIELQGIAVASTGAASREVRHEATTKHLVRGATLRRIRPPAEAINALSIGASQTDGSAFVDGYGARFELVVEDAPSPITGLGPGLDRAIKPDIFLPGGRVIYRESVTARTAGDAILEFPDVAALRASPPGVRVARPGISIADGEGNRGYSWGTSDAAAYASHLAGAILETLDERIVESDELGLDEIRTACLVKALVAHGAEHGPWYEDVLREFSAYPRHKRALAARIVGNGFVDPSEALAADNEDTSATLVACGNIDSDAVLTYDFPVPDELRSEAVTRHLTITLASIVPTTPGLSRYRPHWVEMEVPAGPLGQAGFRSRINNDKDASKRGSLQHESWVAPRAVAWPERFTFPIRVIGRTRTDGPPNPMPFALIATFSVGEPGIAIYQSVRARVRPAVRVGRVGVR